MAVKRCCAAACFVELQVAPAQDHRQERTWCFHRALAAAAPLVLHDHECLLLGRLWAYVLRRGQRARSRVGEPGATGVQEHATRQRCLLLAPTDDREGAAALDVMIRGAPTQRGGGRTAS